MGNFLTQKAFQFLTEREREREKALYKEYAYCISFKELKGPFQQVDSFTQI